MPRKSIHTLIICLLLMLGVSAQEIHFSQFNNNQLLINPALSGNFDGNLRLGVSYRSQGNAISVPYTTAAASGDVRLEPSKLRKSAIGLGLNLYNDKAGEGSLNTTSGYFTASFIRGFNRDNSFRAALGFSVGIINRSIDFSKLVFDNQWNGTIFDPNVASQEPYTESSLFAPDFNLGGMVCWDIRENLKINTGLAMHHINRPLLTFYESENRLERRLIFHALLRAQISQGFEIDPGLYISAQAGASEIVVGSDFLIIKDDLILMAGLWYRHERDIIPMVGLVYNGFKFGFSYDVNISKLHIASNYRGGLEVSLVKILSLDTNKMSCFDF